jgi:GTP-dependent phosphoenolpyruvate carboxykinase
MLPFCGYNMGDYFAHWLKIGEAADESKLPTATTAVASWVTCRRRWPMVWPMLKLASHSAHTCMKSLINRVTALRL